MLDQKATKGQALPQLGLPSKGTCMRMVQELQRRVEALQAELSRLHGQLKQRQPMRNSSLDLDGADSHRNSAATEIVQPADSWTLTELLDTEYIANPGRVQRRNIAARGEPSSGFGDLLQPDARSGSQQKSRALQPGIRTQPPSRAGAGQRGVSRCFCFCYCSGSMRAADCEDARSLNDLHSRCRSRDICWLGCNHDSTAKRL